MRRIIDQLSTVEATIHIKQLIVWKHVLWRRTVAEQERIELSLLEYGRITARQLDTECSTTI